MKKFCYFQGLLIFFLPENVLKKGFYYLIFSSLFSTYLYEKAEKENAVERGFPTNNKVKYLHRMQISLLILLNIIVN